MDQILDQLSYWHPAEGTILLPFACCSWLKALISNRMCVCAWLDLHLVVMWRRDHLRVFLYFLWGLEQYVLPISVLGGHTEHPVDQDAGHNCLTISWHLWMTNAAFTVMTKNQYFWSKVGLNGLFHRCRHIPFSLFLNVTNNFANINNLGNGMGKND